MARDKKCQGDWLKLPYLTQKKWPRNMTPKSAKELTPNSPKATHKKRQKAKEKVPSALNMKKRHEVQDSKASCKPFEIYIIKIIFYY